MRDRATVVQMTSGYVDTALGQVRYVSEGAGTPVVLLPQAGRSSRLLAPLLPLLAPHCRAIAVDLPGFGSVPAPSDVSIEGLADCLLEAFDRLGLEQVNLYGLHTGNKIAAAAAVSQPHRIASLVLAGQSHSIIPDQETRNAAIFKVIGGRYGRPSPLDAAAARAADWGSVFRSITDVWWSERLLAGGMQETDLALARAAVLDQVETMASTSAIYAANFAYDLAAAFRSIAVQTLVLEIATPQEDRVIGRQGAIVQSLVAGSQLATIEDEREGIVTLEDRPDALTPVILDFLRLSAVEQE